MEAGQSSTSVAHLSLTSIHRPLLVTRRRFIGLHTSLRSPCLPSAAAGLEAGPAGVDPLRAARERERLLASERSTLGPHVETTTRAAEERMRSVTVLRLDLGARLGGMCAQTVAGGIADDTTTEHATEGQG